MSDSFDGLVSPLSHFGLIYISGPDTQRFLQGQVTLDVKQLASAHLMPGALCNPKGRVVASFMATLLDEGILLVLPADVLSTTLAHLKKYAAFFKTELADASKRWHLLGMDHNLPLQPGIKALLPWGDGRYLCLLDPLETQYEQALEQCLANKKAMTEPWWQALDIQLGRAWVDVHNTELHTPHALNFQWNGTVNFKKGCYTGQEVVSRMQFKAKLKSIAYALHSTIPMNIGGAVYDSDGKAVGSVVNSSQDWILAVVSIKSVSQGLFADDSRQAALRVHPLPYESAIAATLEKQG